jgi:hypothetical protein
MGPLRIAYRSVNEALGGGSDCWRETILQAAASTFVFDRVLAGKRMVIAVTLDVEPRGPHSPSNLNAL